MADRKIENPPKTDGPGLKVIHASLFRSATLSMAGAYRILGYRTHHALDDMWANPWSRIADAADATWPAINKPGTPPFSRADWDEMSGNEYDICTDIHSPFVPELIKAYPDAKVVVVQREFESWWPSFKAECLDPLWEPNRFLTFWVSKNIVGLHAPNAMQKIWFGFFKVRRPEDLTKDVARRTTDAYYDRVRKMVPADRLLEYKMGDDWEPLCKFLGKPVPDVPFPRLNDRAQHAKGRDERSIQFKSKALATMKPLLVAVLAILLAVFVARSQYLK